MRLTWPGWARRSPRHDLPEFVSAPAVSDLPPAKLQAGARYFGTVVNKGGPERVVARGLGARSTARLSLSAEGLDVVRLAGSFRLNADKLDHGASAGTTDAHHLWIRSISKVAKEHSA